MPDSDLPQNSLRALERIRAMLAEVTCRDSGRLPTERELAERLDMGRRDIRRALEVLEAEGLIWRKHGSGTYIGPPPAPTAPRGPGAEGAFRLPVSPASLIHVIEARLALEPALARFAALRATPASLARITTYIARIETAEDVDSADLWDSALHREIATATGNPVLLALFDEVNRWRHDEGVRRVRLRARRRIGTPATVHDEHRAILSALTEGDGARAAQAMRDHLASLQQVFLRHASEESAHD